MPNVYNSLQSSFLSLAWPWPGRSLPKGNQWECWDPGVGPNVVRFPVHLPSPMHPYTPNGLQCPSHPYTPMLLYPCWPEYLHSLPAPNVPLTPPTFPHDPNPFDGSLMPPDTPYTLGAPDATYTSAGPSVPTLPASPEMHPDTPYIP